MDWPECVCWSIEPELSKLPVHSAAVRAKFAKAQRNTRKQDLDEKGRSSIDPRRIRDAFRRLRRRFVGLEALTARVRVD